MPPILSIVASIVLAILAVCAPLAWWIANGATEPNFNTLVQLNGISIFAALAAITGLLLKQRHSKEQTCIIAAMAFVAAFLLAVVNNAGGHPNFDYQCVQNAAVNIIQGKSPYGEATGYVLYPPMYAGTMHGAYKAISAIAHLFHWRPDMAQIFNVIFYLFQNMQSAAVVALLWLSYRFTWAMGKLSRLHSAFLACLVVGLSWPIYGTIQWNQVNIYITCLVLFVLTFINTQHIARGFAIALGIHLKAYPALLIPALLLSKEWKASAYSIAFALGLALLTTADFGVGIWQTYFSTAHEFIAKIMQNPPTYMVDGSNVWSAVFCAGRFFTSVTGATQQVSIETVGRITTWVKAIIAAWFAWRLLSRQLQQRGKNALPLQNLFYDNAADFLSFGLIAGPTTLNHHYVLAIPIVLWTIVRSGVRMPLRVLIGCVMISNFQSHIASMMTLAPLGLLLLASARPTTAEPQATDPEQEFAQKPVGIHANEPDRQPAIV